MTDPNSSNQEQYSKPNNTSLFLFFGAVVLISMMIMCPDLSNAAVGVINAVKGCG